MQNAVAQSIAKLLIMDLCKATERKWGARVGMQWWEKSGIELAGAREMVKVAAEKYGMEE